MKNAVYHVSLISMLTELNTTDSAIVAQATVDLFAIFNTHKSLDTCMKVVDLANKYNLTVRTAYEKLNELYVLRFCDKDNRILAESKVTVGPQVVRIVPLQEGCLDYITVADSFGNTHHSDWKTAECPPEVSTMLSNFVVGKDLSVTLFVPNITTEEAPDLEGM